MCEVPPTNSPHIRKVEESGDEEDLVDKLISKSGCGESHYLVQECMVEHQDWRKCQGALRTFQSCMTNSKKVNGGK